MRTYMRHTRRDTYLHTHVYIFWANVLDCSPHLLNIATSPIIKQYVAATNHYLTAIETHGLAHLPVMMCGDPVGAAYPAKAEDPS